MNGIGYIVGNNLQSLQEQWTQLIEAKVDHILFDRHCLSSGFDIDLPPEGLPLSVRES